MLKKISVLILALILSCAAFTACGSDETKTASKDDTSKANKISGEDEDDDEEDEPKGGGLDREDTAPKGDDKPFTGEYWFDGDFNKLYAYTEIIDNAPAGFTVFASPKQLRVGFNEDERQINVGHERYIQIIYTDGGKYDRTYIGSSYNGEWDGNGYVFWDYLSHDSSQSDYSGNSTNGDCYEFFPETGQVFKEERAMGETVSETEMPSGKKGGYTYWYLNDEETYGYCESDTYSGFFSGKGDFDNATDYGFFFNQKDGHTYRGEVKDGEPNGLGIYTYPDYDIYIGQFRDGEPDGYGFYEISDGDLSRTPLYYFVKFYNGELVDKIEFRPQDAPIRFPREAFYE